jgi:hypothetical protein
MPACSFEHAHISCFTLDKIEYFTRRYRILAKRPIAQAKIYALVKNQQFPVVKFSKNLLQ